jgi:hypothetical protein
MDGSATVPTPAPPAAAPTAFEMFCMMVSFHLGQTRIFNAVSFDRNCATSVVAEGRRRRGNRRDG